MTLDSLEKVSVCEGHVPGDGGNAGGEAKPPSSAGTSTIGGHHHHHHATHKGTLTVPPPYSADERAAPLEAREPLDCWACAILLTAHNTCVAALNLLLLALVFGLLLLPAIVMVWFGFSCHSRMVRIRLPLCQGVLNDNSSTALIIVGFVLMSPLLVLALAAYCRMARRLQLGFCFLPYSRAVYKPPLPAGLAAPRCPRLLAPCCCCYYTRGSLSGGSTTPHGTRSVWV